MGQRVSQGWDSRCKGCQFQYTGGIYVHFAFTPWKVPYGFTLWCEHMRNTKKFTSTPLPQISSVGGLVLPKEIQEPDLSWISEKQQLFIWNPHVLGIVYFYLLCLAALQVGPWAWWPDSAEHTGYSEQQLTHVYFQLLMCQEGAREFVKSYIAWAWAECPPLCHHFYVKVSI